MPSAGRIHHRAEHHPGHRQGVCHHQAVRRGYRRPPPAGRGHQRAKRPAWHGHHQGVRVSVAISPAGHQGMPCAVATTGRAWPSSARQHATISRAHPAGRSHQRAKRPAWHGHHQAVRRQLAGHRQGVRVSVAISPATGRAWPYPSAGRASRRPPPPGISRQRIRCAGVDVDTARQSIRACGTPWTPPAGRVPCPPCRPHPPPPGIHPAAEHHAATTARHPSGSGRAASAPATGRACAVSTMPPASITARHPSGRACAASAPATARHLSAGKASGRVRSHQPGSASGRPPPPAGRVPPSGRAPCTPPGAAIFPGNV